MKKLLTLIMALVLVIALAGCTYIPESVKDFLGMSEQPDAGDNSGETNQPPTGEEEEQTHTHEFVRSEDSVDATCEAEGYIKMVCACGEVQSEERPAATGHDMQPNGGMAVTCTQKGVNYFKCANCGKNKSEIVPALGHDFGEAPEASRFACCTREGCVTGAFITESNGTYTEQLTFNFTSDDEQVIQDKYDEILAALEAAPEYDPTLHGYASSGELADEYAVVDALHTELYDLVLGAITQRMIAEITYYCNMDNPYYEELYSYMSDYYTSLIATFYSLSQPFYDSCYREFFYYGMTEEEINAYLFDSSAVSDPEYVELKNRNDAIELEILGMSDSTTNDQVPVLYAEFVANNNRIAQIMGYDNYLEYAYGNVYSRDYTYTDVSAVVDYVKQYITPVFISEYINYRNVMQEGDYNKNEYISHSTASFFKDMKGNTTLNDFIDMMAFTSNPDKMYSFSDEFNGLMSNGNMFRGQYSGAFVTYLYAVDIPIAYFSGGYDNVFTIAHEFGHYMNEIYNRSEYDQSYDLLEIHSQGNEMLYLSFLDGQMDGSAYKAVRADQITNIFYIVMAGIAVDTFEQAIYLNYYDGVGADEIMADGNITADEYDKLYYYITEDLGVRGFISDNYWRYGMTFTSPCYYVSYSVSALSAIEIFALAESEGLEVASEAYLKLISYTDENPDMSMIEVIEYAGLHSFTEEELYIFLSEYFT